MSNLYPVKFGPIHKERVWGGSQLKSWFGEQSSQRIGEYWVLSGHPNGTSVVQNGKLAGKTLVELCEQYGEAYLGVSPQKRFPLLIKFLEANTDLSIQIHPDDAYAKVHELDFGKTEAWYILPCSEQRRVNVGHTFSNVEEFRTAIAQSRVEDYLCYQSVQPGQLVFVPSRTLHALLAGTMVIEVQQTSDVTYRVYDWNRVDVNGNHRELHVDKAAEVMQFGALDQPTLAAKPRRLLQTPLVNHDLLIECQYFTIEKFVIQKGAHLLSLKKEGNPDIVVVAEGEGLLTWPGAEEPLSLKRGDTVLVPSTLENFQIKTPEMITVLRVNY